MVFEPIHTLASLLCGSPATTDQVRPFVSLDGEWKLTLPGKSEVYRIEVPGSWQAQIPELRDYAGRAIYSRQVLVPELWSDKMIFIRFGAVDYFAEVYVNGKKVGDHEGGYTPFEFEIRDYIKPGAINDIRVEVVDPARERPVEGYRFEEIPHGKQSWYGNVSGLWQSVRLEARNASYIERILVDPDVDTSTARARIRLIRAQKGSIRLSVQVPKGAAQVQGAVLDVDDGQEELVWTASIPHAALWSPDSPSLYTIRAELLIDGRVADALTARFGMRKIEARGGKIYLNKKQIFLAGALDQDFYPLTEYTVPSDEFLKEQFLKAKQLGLNLLRCHIKAPDPRYLAWADRLGLLVWYEIPNWIELNDNSKRRARETLDAMLIRDYNHPSLVIVSIINESWGVNLQDADHRKWVVEMYDYAKSILPGRLVVDNSPCGGNFHIKTDIEDFHAYYQIPDQADEYRKWIADFAKHPDWTFTPTPDNQRRGFEPLVLSEFGNWGLPRISNLEKVYKGDPWWFGDRHSPSKEPTHPAGVQDRFAEYHLDRVFGTLDGLADAFQEQEWLALKFQIEEMRKYPSIAGYVITEFTDIHWESNGLLDWCRNPKTFHDLMPLVQEQDIVFAHPERRNYRSGDQVRLDAWISHFSTRELAGSKVTWHVVGTEIKGDIKLNDIAQGDAKKVCEISFVAPSVDAPKRMRLELALLSAGLKTIAENYEEFTVFPYTRPEMPKDVLVTTGLDKDTLEQIRKGANAVICIESPEQMPTIPDGLAVVSRSNDNRWGAWCNSVIWFKDSPAFAGAPVPKTMDFSFENIIPNCVIEGIEPRYWEEDVLSGIFVGWVQLNAAVVAQVRCGEGKVLITTLPLVSASKIDPMAAFLLDSLARYVASDQCNPKLRKELSISQPIQ